MQQKRQGVLLEMMAIHQTFIKKKKFSDLLAPSSGSLPTNTKKSLITLIYQKKKERKIPSNVVVTTYMAW